MSGSGGTGLSDRREDFIDPHAEVIVEHEDLASSDESFVDENVDGIAGEFIEFDDGAGFEPQDILDEHACTTEFDFDVEFDVLEKLDAGGVGQGGGLGGLEIGQLE